MADDLGDSHDSSLKQGGALPASSTAWRTAGEVFDQSGKTITVNLYPNNTTPNLTVSIYNHAGTSVATTSGTGNLTLSYTPGSDGFYTVKVKNTSSTNPSQTAYVKVTYTSPMSVNTSTYPAAAQPEVLQRAPASLPVDAASGRWSLSVYPAPVRGVSQVAFELPVSSPVELSVLDLNGRRVKVLASGVMSAGKQTISFDGATLAAGVYIVRLHTTEGTETRQVVIGR